MLRFGFALPNMEFHQAGGFFPPFTPFHLPSNIPSHCPFFTHECGVSPRLCFFSFVRLTVFIATHFFFSLSLLMYVNQFNKFKHVLGNPRTPLTPTTLPLLNHGSVFQTPTANCDMFGFVSGLRMDGLSGEESSQPECFSPVN